MAPPPSCFLAPVAWIGGRRERDGGTVCCWRSEPGNQEDWQSGNAEIDLAPRARTEEERRDRARAERREEDTDNKHFTFYAAFFFFIKVFRCLLAPTAVFSPSCFSFYLTDKKKSKKCVFLSFGFRTFFLTFYFLFLHQTWMCWRITVFSRNFNSSTTLVISPRCLPLRRTGSRSDDTFKLHICLGGEKIK